MKKLITLIILIFSTHIQSQDIKYARSILDTLCSTSFDGRGFYNSGEKRTAEFIKNEYYKFGLRPFNESYFQSFSLSTNSIIGKVLIKVDNNELSPAQDFLISPSSPKFKGSTEIFRLKKEELLDLNKFKLAINKADKKIIVINQLLVKDESRKIKQQVRELIDFLKFTPNLSIKGVIELISGKLTYTASQQLAERPHIIILEEKFPSPSENITIHIENKFIESHTSQNVIGYIKGEIKDRFICITGHYDHLGRMGDKTYFPGANDNASGIAMLLNLAKKLSKEDLKYSIVFMAFGSEEIGLVGSKYYTENPLFPLSKIKFLINLDILGTGEDGIQVVNGKEHPLEFNQLVHINKKNNYLKQVKIRGAACNSDHCFFHKKKVPSFFIYTLGGVAHYHNIYDKSETLPLTEYKDLFCLLKDFILEQE